MGILGPIGMVLTLAALACVPVYPVLQLRALTRWRGTWLWVALVPLAVMLLAVGAMIQGLRADSNLAPILVVFPAPVCVLWLWVAGKARGS